MKYQYILLEVKDKIAWLTFNRPEQLNAMNAQMMDEIIHALGEINQADSKHVRLAVITGAGKAFMAGADIKEYAQQTQEQFEDFQTKGYSPTLQRKGRKRYRVFIGKVWREISKHLRY